MIILTEITDDPKQKFQIQLENNQTFTLDIEFVEQQECWYCSISDIQNNSLVINSLRLTTMPNILRQWARIIPFGIAIESEDGDDPFAIDDFLTKRVTLNILNEEEVAEVESALLTA